MARPDAAAIGVEHRFDGAVDRPVERDIDQHPHGLRHRRIPSAGERLAAGRAAQAIGAAGRHMDGTRRFGDRSAIGKRLDKVALLAVRPAIGTRFAADGDPLIVGGVIAVGVEIRRLGRYGQVRGVERRGRRGRMLRELGVVAHGRDGNILGTCRTVVFWGQSVEVNY